MMKPFWLWKTICRLLTLSRMFSRVWEGDGFLLLYKRLECAGTFKWPRYAEEAAEITQEQLQNLMKGFEVIPQKTIKEIEPPKYIG